jgi:hypothetical protein
VDGAAVRCVVAVSLICGSTSYRPELAYITHNIWCMTTANINLLYQMFGLQVITLSDH